MLSFTSTAGERAANWLHLAALLALAALVAVGIARLPEPITRRMIESDIRAQAAIWEQRLVQTLDRGARTFARGEFTARDEAYLRHIVRASDLYRIKLFAADGTIIWSSRPDEVGGVGHDASFVDVVARGGTLYKAEGKRYDEIDNAALHIGPGELSLERDVAEVYTPVMEDGRFVGAIEFYRDVTTLHTTSVARVRAVIAAVSGTALVLLALVSWATIRDSRRRVAEVRAQAEKARAVMADQVRLSREVQLLGELNEWLQSSRSLQELFGMVSRFMAHVLPGVAGSLYVYSNFRDVLEGAASWCGGTHRDHIRPEDCWGLRRGRAYAFGGSAVDFPCGHVHDDAGPDAAAPDRYVCLPILAHGETVGLMSLRPAPNAAPAAFDAQRRLAQMCAEQVSMAIANVRMRDELQHQAIRDPLTGLFNQRHMLEQLRRHVDARGAREVSLVSLDVDHFKRFNDNFGHDAGDMVLRAVGETLARQADGDEVACRVGGEEFTLLLPGLSAAQAMERAERARHDLSQITVRYGDRALPRVTVSVGVAHCPSHGTTPQELIRPADDALYAAKAKGRNCVVLAGHAADEGAEAAHGTAPGWAEAAAEAPLLRSA